MKHYMKIRSGFIIFEILWYGETHVNLPGKYSKDNT